MSKLFIYGDSIIDNGAYVSSAEPDVPDQIRAVLPDVSIMSHAVDGARCDEIFEQIRASPPPIDAAVLLTGGGNDAIDTMWVLGEEEDRTFPEVLALLTNIKEQFREKYVPLLKVLVGRRVLAATIYNPSFSDPVNEGMLRPAIGMLTAFNDVIQQEALSRDFSVLELRNLFLERQDFANPIEPSAQGGEKIARAVGTWFNRFDGLDRA